MSLKARDQELVLKHEKWARRRARAWVNRSGGRLIGVGGVEDAEQEAMIALCGAVLKYGGRTEEELLGRADVMIHRRLNEQCLERNLVPSPGCGRKLLLSDKSKLGPAQRKRLDKIEATFRCCQGGFDVAFEEDGGPIPGELDWAVGQLTPRRAECVRLLFGLGCAEHSQEEAAEAMGIGQSRVSQLLSAALDQLRHIIGKRKGE